MPRPKHPRADLRRRYAFFFELGLAVALLLLIAAFRIDVRLENDSDFTVSEPEIVPLEDMPQSKHIEKPPPPPRPPVPIEVPNDALLEDEDILIDATIDFDEPVTLPPPPPGPDEEPEPDLFEVVEDMPELIGGIQELQKKIRYPEIAKKAGVEGTVFLQFIVDENGNVVNPVVLRGIGAGCDEEALRVIRQAKFEPGRQRGKAVKVKFGLPIRYKLR